MHDQGTRSARSQPVGDVRPLQVLVADEDPDVLARLETTSFGGFRLVTCADGAQALWCAGRMSPDVVVLSASLPVVPAAEVASILTAQRDGDAVVLVGVGFGQADLAGPVLAAGATGMVSRPCEERELAPAFTTAHLRVLEQRRRAEVVGVGALRLDGAAYSATVDGRPVALTLREFELLRLLLVHVGELVGHDRIRAEIWGPRGESVTPNTVAVHVRRLRRHLRGAAEITVVRGLGYRLTVPHPDRPAAARRPSAPTHAGP